MLGIVERCGEQGVQRTAKGDIAGGQAADMRDHVATMHRWRPRRLANFDSFGGNEPKRNCIRHRRFSISKTANARWSFFGAFLSAAIALSASWISCSTCARVYRASGS